MMIGCNATTLESSPNPPRRTDSLESIGAPRETKAATTPTNKPSFSPAKKAPPMRTCDFLILAFLAR